MRPDWFPASILLASLCAQEPQAPPAAPGVPGPAAPTDLTRALAWRNIGPCNPQGRITDIEIHPARPSTWFAGTGGGGVFRTTNAGTTWEPVFDRHGTVSIGDVATAPSNPDIVWIGTGEENARNSVQWGDGVYKSTDGGATWVHSGLRETFQIGHVAIHPTNPDIVFVAALGRLWGPNEERGVYRTTDGGANWERVHFLDERTGCIDVRIDPSNPQVVYAAMYERARGMFDDNDPSVRFSSASGLWKSTDGGSTWRKLEQGLPSCKWGRSGLAMWDKDPSVLFAIVETERSGWATGSRQSAAAPQGEQPRGTASLGIGMEGEDGSEAAPGAILTTVTDGGAAAQSGIRAGDRVTKVGTEAVRTFADLIAIVRDSRGGEKATFTVARGAQSLEVEVTYATRQQGGGMATGSAPFGGRLGGQVENRQEQQGTDGFETGGIFRSNDGGESWQRLNSLNERPFYYSVIAVDPQSDQNLYSVGVNLWASFDGGKKFAAINRGIHVDFHSVWVDPRDGNHLVAGCDGGVNESFDRGQSWQVHHGFSAAQYYKVATDNSVPYRVVGGLQDNGTWVGPSRTRRREGILHEDWNYIWGGDGFGAVVDPIEPWFVFATSQNGAMGMLDLRSGNQLRPERGRVTGGPAARFNWDAPFVLSPHNRLVVHHAGNYVWRGDRYAHLDNRDVRADQGPIRNAGSIRMTAVSPVLGLTEQGTATALAESPRVRGLIYVGTDDGALWRTDDDGRNWVQLHANLPGVPGPRYVSDVWPSAHRDDRVYVTLDGHRSDDFAPYVFVSDDRGATWRFLGHDLATNEPVHAIAEDPRREGLLYLGTEFGAWVSFDGGDVWAPLGSGLPTVCVRDLCIQDRDSDLVAGTHGRGVWILDVQPLRQWNKAAAEAAVQLFQPEDAVLWRMSSRGAQGHRNYAAPNPAYGATFHLHLAAAPEAAPVLTVHDVKGDKVAELKGKAEAGLQVLQWDARTNNRLAPAGTYSVRFVHDGKTTARAFTLHPDPGTSPVEPGVLEPTTPLSRE